MIISPFLGFRLQPSVCHWLKQSRNLRPTVKIGKEKFQLSIDVRNFVKEELRVKARQEYVIVEGKQERKTANGYVIRQFVRKFKLPHGCSQDTIKSQLSSDGILTITAPRSFSEMNLPCEKLVPIRKSDAKKADETAFLQVDDLVKQPCDPYLKNANKIINNEKVDEKPENKTK